MASDVSAGLKQLEKRDELLAGVPPQYGDAATQKLDTLRTQLKQLELAVKTQQPDAVSLRVADVLKSISDYELLQAPGLPFSIPKEYASQPKLIGRAVVEVVVERRDGSLSFVDRKNGGLTNRGTVEITLDGYSAPISAGNFAANVADGLYNDRVVQSSYASLIVTTADSAPSRPPIPLEILPSGEFDPMYRIPLDVQGGELPVLPLSISGAVSMTHVSGSDSMLSGDEWFVYKFDKQQAGLSGLAFDEGSFGVFGYVTRGMDVISTLKTGDVIVSARLVSGADKLVRPAPQPSLASGA